jgi:hypothetical protein
VGQSSWRRGRDSNPRRSSRPPNDLANHPLQPLGYLSVLIVKTWRKGWDSGLRPSSLSLRRTALGSTPTSSFEESIYLLQRYLVFLAEGVGFEPTDPLRSPVFKTGALDHYATLPRRSSNWASLNFSLANWLRSFLHAPMGALPFFRRTGVIISRVREIGQTDILSTTIL